MQPAQPLPLVTLILPVRNEASYIRQTLDSVFAQDYPADSLQIIVADGLSTDATRQIVAEYQAVYPNLALIDNPGRIVPTGLNRAIRQARGEVVIRVDGHCVIAHDYVSRCVAHILEDPVDAVGGSVETIGETGLARAIALAMSSPFGVGDSAFRTLSGTTRFVDSVPFPAYTRAIIDQAGFFDEELTRNQDDEYNYRLRKLGAKILLSAQIRSKYYSRASLSSLWRQYFQYGFWKVRVLQKHPLQMRPRQFVPPLFTFSLLGSALLGLLWRPAGALFIFTAALYLLASLAASLWTAARRGWSHLPLLPLVFAVLHLSYGLGFLTGLLKFWNRWGDKQGKVPAASPAFAPASDRADTQPGKRLSA